MPLSIEDFVILPMCAFFGNVGVSLTGFGMAILYVLTWQVASVAGYPGADLKYAIFIQAVALMSVQPILLYRTDIRKYAHRKILAYFIPITVISTPLGQWTSAHVPVDMLQRIAGILVTLLAVWEVYQQRGNATAIWNHLSPGGTNGRGSLAGSSSRVGGGRSDDDDASFATLPKELGLGVVYRSPPTKTTGKTKGDVEMAGTTTPPVRFKSKKRAKDARNALDKAIDELDKEQKENADPSETAYLLEETSASGESAVVIVPTITDTNNVYGEIKTITGPTGTKTTRDFGTQTTREMGTQTDFSDRLVTRSEIRYVSWAPPSWWCRLQRYFSAGSSTMITSTDHLSSHTIALTLLAGGASGFLGGLCGIRGPPLIAYFLHPPIPFDKQTQRATALCITFVNVSTRMVYYIVDVFRQESFIVASDWGLYLAVFLASIWGCFVGSEMFELLKDSRNVIRAILSVFLFLCGVSLLLSSFFDL